MLTDDEKRVLAQALQDYITSSFVDNEFNEKE